MENPDETLTVKQAADYLGITVGWLYQLRAADAGPLSTRVGRRLQYRKRDLDRYTAHRR